MASLYPGFDVASLLSRSLVPYQAPRAPDYSALLNALGAFSQGQTHEKDQQRELELAQAKMAQDAQQASMRDQTQRYGYDLQEQGRKESQAGQNTRADNQHLNDLIKSYAAAQVSGDIASQSAIQQELQRAGGWTLSERASRLQPEAAPQAPQPQEQQPSGPAPNPQDLESGGRSTAVNPRTGAAGIFQAMPDTLKSMGYSREQWLAMSPEQQKEEYWNNYLPKVKGFSPERIAQLQQGTPEAKGENYLAIAAPSFAAKGTSDETAIYHEGSRAYDQNKVWDVNKDGIVSAGEIRQLGRGGAGSSVLKPREIDLDEPGAPGVRMMSEQQIGPPDRSQAPATGLTFDPVTHEPVVSRETSPAADEEKPGGGRFVFTDRNGKVVYEYDRPQIQSEQKKAVREGMQSILESANTPEEKRAAQAALGLATSMAGSGFTVKDATTLGIKQYMGAVGEAGKGDRAQIVATGRAQAQDLLVQKATEADFNKATQQTAKDYGLSKLTEAETDVKGALSALDANNGLGDMGALKKYIRSMDNRITDTDYRVAANSSGILNRIIGLPDKWFEGQLDPETRKNLRSILEKSAQDIQKRRQEAAEVAARRISEAPPYSDPSVIQKNADRARQYFLGSPAQGGSDMSNDDLMRLVP